MPDSIGMSRHNARHAPPRAAAMMEALRGLGYSTGGALADIVDNSIAAHADQVAIDFRWDDGRASIAVLDNGDGMDDAELDRAMRLGQLSPLSARRHDDLGRFGMGLKTASFSQCRRLTVASQKEGRYACLRWDLDLLSGGQDGDDGWYLLEGPSEGSESLVALPPSTAHGTVVLWEIMDRIVTAGFREQNFLDLMDVVERHLAMVFHRLIDGPHPVLRLLINGRPIQPWDPFLAGHSATWSSPVDHIVGPAGDVAVQSFVLPHRDRLSAEEFGRAAGPDGWTAQQGFYVYRNKRLLVAGSWLGLGRGRSWTKEEAHRLARISIDVPNSADFAWKLDIRKSLARPPVEIRDRLMRLAEDARARARRVFAHRGQAQVLPDRRPLVQAWRAEHFAGGMRYRIDEAHEAIQSVLADAGDLRARVLAMLRVIEATVPVQRIWLDTVESQETPRTGFAGQPATDVTAILLVMYRNMVLRRGLTPMSAREQLSQTEPFNQFPDLVSGLPDELSETE